MFRNYTQEQTRESQRALRRAWAEGVLDPLYLHPPILNWHPPRPDPIAAKLLDREPPTRPRNDRITDQLNEPAYDTRAQNYQDNSYFIGTIIQPDTAYEVARFVTAGNETGFVKLCWTYVNVSGSDLDPRNPFAVQLALGAPYNVRWIARMEQGQFSRQAPAPGVFPVPNIPGYGYYGLSEWRDYRFQWGRTQASVFWLVPQYHALRLYFVLEGPEPNPGLNEIGGRLKGYTQPIDVRTTGWNVSHGFD